MSLVTAPTVPLLLYVKGAPPPGTVGPVGGTHQPVPTSSAQARSTSLVLLPSLTSNGLRFGSPMGPTVKIGVPWGTPPETATSSMLAIQLPTLRMGVEKSRLTRYLLGGPDCSMIRYPVWLGADGFVSG